MALAGYEYAYGRSLDGYVQAGIGLGGGVGMPLEEDPTFWLVLPLTHHLSIGPGAHRFEACLGAAYEYPANGHSSLFLPILPIIQIGYRYQPPGQRLIWRVHIGSPGIGASVGWAF